MIFLGNLLWLVLAGIWLAMGYVAFGLLNVVFVITIPFAVQAFKLAGFALWPFGRMVVRRREADRSVSFLANVVWFVFGGFWLALLHIAAGVLLAVTVVGIPFAVASFKLAGLALSPFGKIVVDAAEEWPPEDIVLQELRVG